MTFWQKASQPHPGSHWLVSLTSPQEAAIRSSNWWISNIARRFPCFLSLSVVGGWNWSQHDKDLHLSVLHLLCWSLSIHCENTKLLLTDEKVGHGLCLFYVISFAFLYVTVCLEFRGDNSINVAKARNSKPSLFISKICIIKRHQTAEGPLTF